MNAKKSFYALLFIKAFRTFVFSYISLVIPFYLYSLKYNSIVVGAVLLIIMLGNAVSNVTLIKLSAFLGERQILLLYSLMITISGFMLYSFKNIFLISLAGFIGNISAGTETGPFQSIESAGLTRFINPSFRNRAYGYYNFIGFIFTALGAAFTSFISRMLSKDFFNFSFLLYSALGILLFVMYNVMKWPNLTKPPLKNIKPEYKRHIYLLSSLFFTDSFGGGFVTQSVLSYWFLIRFKLSIQTLGGVFFITNIISSISIYLSSYLSDRIGNIRTMVYTHFTSNIFLLFFAIAPWLSVALAFLFIRQTLSQMDVPARQSFIAYMFDEEARVYASAITNIFRSFGVVPGPYITGALLSANLDSVPIMIASVTKMSYDISLYAIYNKYEK